MTNRVNSIDIKKINRNIIYRFLYRREPISIQEIAHQLKLSLPTVTHNIKELQERDLVMDMGLFESTGGRKAKAIAYNPAARYSIGLDVTKNHVGIVIIDLSGNVINHVRTKFPFQNTDEYFIGVGALVQSFIADNGIPGDKILGVGIALPAILSQDNQYVSYATVIDFKGGRVDRFAERIPYPCVLSNDANAAGFAELWFEGNIQNVVYLSLNNSVGGSIIIGKQIYTGENQRSGEFGHMTIVPDGDTCYCGKTGCVDVYCSAKVLSDSTDGNIAEFFRLLKLGREPQTTLWNQYLNHLVIVVNNLRMLYDCNVIIGGYAGAYMDDYLEQIREIAARRNTFEQDGSYLQICRYKLEATAVGAALQIVERYINSI